MSLRSVWTSCFCFLTIFAVSVLDAAAQDWPQWRGPNRDGRIAKGPAQWPRKLTRQWKVQVGEGHSSPVVVGGQIFIHARQQDREVVRCLNLASGKQVWMKSYPAPYQMDSAARGHGKGPKSTPSVADGKLVTFGISGILSCFDAKTGRMLWQKEFSKQFPRTSAQYGTAMSPLVHRGLVIAHVGGKDKGALTAFAAATGKVRWSWTGDGPGYASPIVVNLAGTEQIVTQTQNNVVGVSPLKGTLLWRMPYKTAYEQNSVTPAVYQQTLIFSGYQVPTAGFRFSKRGSKWTPTQSWANKDIPMYMSSPVVSGNLIYGMTQRGAGRLFCADASSGKIHWNGKGRLGKNAAIIAAGQVILVQSTTGDVQVVKNGPKQLQIIAQYKVADSATWAHPALVGNRLLVKDVNSLACFRIGG